jgi:threonyl-tRNA synthetase
MSQQLDEKLEKKSAEERRLWALRHTAEHVLHQAVKELYPDIQLAMGPATEEGFYFDFDPSPEKKPVVRISDENFPAIEQRMAEIIARDMPLVRQELSAGDARKLFADNPYKLEWITDIEKRGEKVSVYWTGTPGSEGAMADLCSGPHAESTGKVGAFKLLSVAGAYWHGDEKNKMLTRIYGTAFGDKKQLDEWLARQEEAKKRDHRKIGKDLGLFVFSDLVGRGLPMLTPKGATIRRELERFIIDEELKRGYLHVVTPSLAKTDLYKTSGHYPYYKDTMYPPMKVEEEELILRPMTCPHHFMLYASEPRSYRDLPMRIAECADLFRYEKSGELTGLMRVRMFCLADAHIVAMKEQAKDEIKGVLDLIGYVNAVFGMEKGTDYRFRLSLGDRKDTKKYYKDDAAWEHAENVLREVLVETGAPFYEAENEAAFYGPKIDVQVKNVAGHEETAFTVQYDFVMPERFDLTYTGTDGKPQRPVVIHRSSLGAFERTMAFLIEKYGGAFPVWLSPVQMSLVPIAERHLAKAQEVATRMKARGIRVEVNSGNEPMGAKIRSATLQKVPYIGIIGDKEAANETVALRSRSGQQTVESVDDSIARIVTDIEHKR